MISLSKFASQHMLVVFFIYGLAFFFLGTAILLKQDKRSTLRLRGLLLLLAGFGLLHGVSGRICLSRLAKHIGRRLFFELSR